MKKIILFLLTFLILMPTVKAEEDLASNSKSAILIEASTGEILFQKNIHEKLAPASMTKLMSMLLIMEAIDSNKIGLEDIVVISASASGMGGSQIYLETGSKVRVRELLKGIAIASANDAVVALAEKVGGTETNFVNMMNERSKSLGLKNTNFKNPHGLDDSDHYSSAYDMAMIAKELVKHETILDYTKIYEEYLNKPDGSSVWLVNTNKLVRFYEGVDGLKTGFTSIAGYCLTATAKRNNLRLISVVMNVPTSEQRSADTTKLLNFGFNTFKINTIITTEDEIGKISVHNAKNETVELKLMEDIVELQKVTDDNKEYTFEIKQDKVKAPIKAGKQVGKLIVYANGSIFKEAPLTVAEDVKKANIFNLIWRNLKIIASGKALF